TRFSRDWSSDVCLPIYCDVVSTEVDEAEALVVRGVEMPQPLEVPADVAVLRWGRHLNNRRISVYRGIALIRIDAPCKQRRGCSGRCRDAPKPFHGPFTERAARSGWRSIEG